MTNTECNGADGALRHDCRSISRDALDFAPGLLAIQESPPERLAGAVLWTLVLLVVGLILWAMLGKVDIVATAEGRLVPQSYLKIVQPADAGVVKEILVGEGDWVEQGQIVIRLDSRISDADLRRVSRELDMQRLQLQRIDAEISGQALKPTGDPKLFSPVLQQYLAHKQTFELALAQERSAYEKTRFDLRSEEEKLHKLKSTLSKYENEARAYQILGDKGYYSDLAVQEKQRELIEKQQDLAAQEAMVESLESALDASDKRVQKTRSSYLSDLQDERLEVESRINRLIEEKNKQQRRSELLNLRAPKAGVVKSLAIHTAGSVVSPGSVLLTLVPERERLRAEVFVRNDDAGFVHVGQPVKLKLAAYPFQKYGMVDGKVVFIGPDADSSSDSGQQQAMPGGDQGIARYRALVELKSQRLEVRGQKRRFSAGMLLAADIQLGRRTVMEYLLSPIQTAWLEAGRER